ncbi:MAG: hypothetical protein Q4F44_04040 [Bacteroidales bacterium]|nr:hypothetical protein [Bacteroidales bacterium]
MKKLFLLFSLSLLLLCSCRFRFREYRHEYNHDDLTALLCDYWNSWKSSGKDTTLCIIDFAEVMPFDWDTLAYYDCSGLEDTDEDDKFLARYGVRFTGFASYLFVKDSVKVERVPFVMASDESHGAYVLTKKRFVKLGRDDSKFHLERAGRYYVLRFIDEEYIPFRWWTRF